MAVPESMTFDYDIELLDRELEQDSARLFLEDHNSFIRVNEGGDDREFGQFRERLTSITFMQPFVCTARSHCWNTSK